MDYNTWLSNQSLGGEDGPLSFNPDENGRYSLKQRSAFRNYGWGGDDEDVGSFLQSKYQFASNPKYGKTPLNFGDNGGFFGDRSVQIGGSPYQRVLEDWSNFDAHPDQGIRDWTKQNRSALSWNDDYGYVLPQDKWNELSTLSARYNKSQEDWIDKGYGGLGLLAIPAAAVAFGAAGAAGAGAAGAEAGYGAGLASELGTAGAYGGSMAADAAALSGGVGASALPAAAAGAGSYGGSVNALTAPLSTNPAWSELMFQAPAVSGVDFAGTIPGLTTNALSTAGGLSLAPGAGLIKAGGGMDWLTNLFSPSSLLNFGGNIGSALINSSAAGKAAGAQQDSARESNALLASMYAQNREDLAPWRQTGVNALMRLARVTAPGSQMSELELDPGYNFRLGEGEKAILRRASALGRVQSGETGKALTKYGQDYATGEYGNVINRLLALSGMGQTATNTGVNAGQNYAGQAGQNITGAGNARASGYIGGANALTGGIGNALNTYMQQQLLNKLIPGGVY